MRESLASGLRFVRRSPILLSGMSLDLFAVLFGGAVAMLPIFASDILQCRTRWSWPDAHRAVRWRAACLLARRVAAAQGTRRA